jgi:hypothetical protein
MGFVNLYSWLEGRDVLIVKADRQEPLVVLRLSLAAGIAGTDLRPFDSPPDCTEKPFEKSNVRPFEK